MINFIKYINNIFDEIYQRLYKKKKKKTFIDFPSEECNLFKKNNKILIHNNGINQRSLNYFYFIKIENFIFFVFIFTTPYYYF